MVLTVVAHEVGLGALSRRSRTSSQRRVDCVHFAFYAGLVTLVLAIMSPLDYWSDDYFFVHMIDHLLLAFFAPILIVLGAPWVPLHVLLARRSHAGPSVEFFYPLHERRGLAVPRTIACAVRSSPWCSSTS